MNIESNLIIQILSAVAFMSFGVFGTFFFMKKSLDESTKLIKSLELEVSSLKTENSVIRKNSELSFSVEVVENRHDGFFKSHHDVDVLLRIYIGGTPTAGTFVVSRFNYSEINEKNVKLAIDAVVSPLVKAGFNVLTESNDLKDAA